MSTNALLKQAKEAITKSNWDAAIEKAQEVIERDDKNYTAHTFLAYGLQKKDKLEEAEKAYLAATNRKPKDLPAWQGLVQLYQKVVPHSVGPRGATKLREYQHAATSLAELHRDAGDMYKCQDVVDKFIDSARINGRPEQYVEALELILPESPLYSALEGRLPNPAKTYETMAQIIGESDSKQINTLIGERRTRIGAKVGEVTLEVKREVFTKSRLADLYRKIIDWSNDDDIRRTYEEKLLQYCHERLLAFPPGEEKSEELKTVLKLANDMVIIKHPFKMAWDIAIDWRDHKDIKEWDFHVLREYITFFPDSDLTRVLSGFLSCTISPFPSIREEDKKKPAKGKGAPEEDESSEDDDDGGAQTAYIPVTEEDRLITMTEGIASADSLFAYRLMGEYYQYLQEYESNVELMKKAKQHLEEESAKTGLSFGLTKDAYSLYLGTALVYYQSPRHHQAAKDLFDEVLSHDPLSTAALIGVGLIWEEEEEHDKAIDFLERALTRDQSNLRVRTEAAWVKALKGDYATGKDELEACIPLLSKDPNNKDLLAHTQYKLGYCIWHLDTSKAARKSREPGSAHSYFVDAIRNNLELAPAYTMLGFYYADYAKSKARARKCFMKALELSPSEVESAERLARTYADDGDWDAVELVAQRIIDSGKVKPPPGSKRKGISWPFSALGVAELNKQDYHKAVVSFQAALKVTPDDYHSLVGMGEGYYHCGRLVSATKAIARAQELEDEGKIDGDTWFTKFLLANIKRELGEYDAAIELYQQVIGTRPAEEGVIIALMQASVENAIDSLEKGFYGKAVQLAKENLAYATEVPTGIASSFNFWKAVADSCSVFSNIQGRVADFPIDAVKELLGSGDASEFQIMQDKDHIDTGVLFAEGLSPEDEKLGGDLTRSLHATILAHKRAVHLSSSDIHAQAVAYYNLGWAEHRAHSCLPVTMRKKASKYLSAAIWCFKRAIELEPGNSEFHNAFGVVTSIANPAVAQHSFVRSLHLNERNVQAWTNLGALALLENDFKIANEAFTRAQSTDPDYAAAWMGQGLVALLYGNIKEARTCFTHGMELSGSSAILPRRLYSISMFDHILSAPANLPIIALIQPIFALTQLQRLKPQDLAYGHLCALFHERVHDTADAIKILENVSDIYEAEYEATESKQAVERFCIAKTDLARSYLATGQYEKAIEALDMVLALSEEEGGELTEDERRKTRLSSHITMGLAQYFSGEAEEALASFESVLEETGGNPDAVCVLAQVLWATGQRERAAGVLRDAINRAPNHVQSALLLGVISLLSDDQKSLQSAVNELQRLRTSGEAASTVQQGAIGEVLRAIVMADPKSTEEDVLSEVQTDVLLRPYLPHGWSELSDVADADEAHKAAEMAVTLAKKGVPPKGELDADDLARAYAGTGRAADGQTAVIVAPWAKEGWTAISEAVRG
ncbi:Superkiller protein 3 [Coniochaeta pulveracea]|uniref:Superkiller protein 3 n=1 Tax=Coniochaeta pulveracea TaxID=177199 RepID=A0A420Y9F6_9PEZI|nr:Superkiller protein 3 [Coniochaeta pulveracea]